jgi:hypothetical protein
MNRILLTTTLTIVVFLALLEAQPAFQELSFTGSLERVMEHSISILLADGRLIDAKLPDKGRLAAPTLSDNYRLGDQVSIHCHTINAHWDEASKIWRYLELDKIRLVGSPNPGQLTAALKSRDWRLPGNLLNPPKEASADAPAITPALSSGSGSAEDARDFLERARGVVLEGASHLPNFIADEIADCSSSRTNPQEWRHTATVESEVTFHGDGEVRKVRRREGPPTTASGVPQGCMGWGGGFGTYLIPLFDPNCGTKFEFVKIVDQSGGQSWVYRYSSPAEGCFTSSYTGYQRAYPTHEGLVVLKYPAGNLVQVKDRSLDFPKAYPIIQRDEMVTWGFVKIGNENHLLPVAFEKLMLTQSGLLNRLTAKYVNHRHFEANTDLTFP